MAENKIKVGVVGYGNAAKKFHLPFVTSIPDYEIYAILQRAEAPADPKSAPAGSHCTVDYPNVKHYRDEESFFADPDTEFIMVVTRDDTHNYFVEKALLAGKHVLTDKPFARTSAEADKVIKLAKEKGLLLTCYQNRRWDAGFQTLRQLLSKNALGKIMEAEIHYDFENPSWVSRMTAKEYTPGSGMSFGLGSHSVDQAVTLFGQPKSVTGFFRTQRGIDSEVDDSFTIVLQYEGDQKELLVTVKTSITSCMDRQLQLLVRGKEGSFVKWQQGSMCAQEEAVFAGKHPLDDGFGVEPDSMRGTLTTYKEFDSCQKLDKVTDKYVGQYPSIKGRWIGLYENVRDAIRGKAELEVKATQSRDAIRVIELARESSNKGVTVPWS